MFGYIYKTTNLINGKIYIGQKKSDKFLEERYLGSGKCLREAINKYGKENFRVELIEEIAAESFMDEREIYWIGFYNSTDKDIGYNLSEGGNVNRTLRGENNPFYGKKHSEDSRLKMSLARKGKKHTWVEGEETKRKRVQSLILSKSNPESIETRINELNEKINSSDNKVNEIQHLIDYRDQLLNILNKMNKHMLVSKEEIAEKLHQNALVNPNYGMRGKSHDEETRKKISTSKTGKTTKAKGRIYITNDLTSIRVSKDELDDYLSSGWRLGRKNFSKKACENISKGHKGQKAHNKGKVWVHNSEINKTINRDEIDKYRSEGWSIGMLPKNK